MDKKVYIIHGWDGGPEEPMLNWLGKSLLEKGFSVEIPEMPDAEYPKIDVWIRKIMEIAQADKNSIFVGHSIGCQAILRYLEQLPEDIKVAGVVFIAPWMKLDRQTIEEEGKEIVEIARPWMETSIDFNKVKAHSGKFIAIFSDDDPYVNLDQKDFFEEKLGAETIIEHKKGHFSPDDGVDKLPIALEKILDM